MFDQNTQLQLYGLYKQATQGDVMISPPQDPVSLAKYNSWLAHKGKSSSQAEVEYIQVVKSFNTGWGIGVSRPQYEEIEESELSPQEAIIKALCDSVKLGNIDNDALNHAGINCQDRQGLTPLHHAVDEGMLEMVEKLIEMGANPNIQDTEGMTPLHYAVELDNSEVLKALLHAPGVDSNIIDADGNSIYSIAQKKCAEVI